MQRRTVIVSRINDDHTAFVLNFGIEELSLFKKLKDNGIELKDDGNISDEEILMLLRHCCIDGFIEGVYSIENHFNRDQKQINIIKTNIENKLEAKGLTIITHTEWVPSFDYDPGPINKRNYLTVVIENINKKELELKKLEKEYELKEKNLNKELENNRIELEETIKNNTAKIKQQNWYIDKTKESEAEYIKAKELLDKEIERYKKGKEYNDNMFKSLPIEIQDLLDRKKSIEKEIDNMNNYLTSLEDDQRLLEAEIKKEQDNYRNLKNEKYKNLINDIKVIINSKNWTKTEALYRFENTCKMYILNDRNLPQFEKDNAISEGITENEIAEILQKYQF